jgi:apolipoprotein N-acyltransferase
VKLGGELGSGLSSGLSEKTVTSAPDERRYFRPPHRARPPVAHHASRPRRPWWQIRRGSAHGRVKTHGLRGRVAVPSLVAGLGFALSLPPWGFWVLAFPAAALLWWRLEGLRLRARALAGWMVGVGMFVPGLWWATSFNTYGGAVLMAAEALAPCLACAAVPRQPRGRTVALAGAMVLGEALRDTWPFGGLPIGSLALGQVAGPLGGSARLGGPLLLVGLVCIAGGGLGLLITAAGRAVTDRRLLRRALRPAAGGVVAMAVVAAVAAGGAAAPDGGSAVGTLRIAAVQGGGVRGLRQAEVAPSVVYGAQVAATDEIASHDGGRAPQLVLWPEDVVALDGLLDGSGAERDLASTAVRLRATLVAGVTDTVSGARFRNEIVAFSPQGSLVARFEKVHRVPFGEYVPYRGFFEHLADLSAVPLDAIPGHANGVLATPAGHLGALVSYEVFYPSRGRVATRAGAQLLIVPTNTSSYRTSQVPCQELAAARLQAIAEGRDLVQAAPTGFSAVIDNRGTVLARTSLSVRAVIVGDVAMRKGQTLYERAGDIPVLLLAVVLVLGGWLRSLGAEVEPPPPPPSSRRRRRRVTLSQRGA